MYVTTIRNRKSPPTHLIRESYRQGGKVKSRTIANITRLGLEKIELIRQVLKGKHLVPAEELFRILRSLPHGHVAAAIGCLRKIGLERLIAKKPSRQRELVVAMIIARLLEPCSKLATARGLHDESASSSLGHLLGLGDVNEDEIYQALDWLLEQQDRIERSLARRHLQGTTLVLYDVTAAWVEGRHCELAAFGHKRGGKKGKMQIVFGLMCAPDGCPIAVEVFKGNTGDPKTLAKQIEKLKERFGLQHVVLVGDRGMITQARLEEDVMPAGLDWITALRAPAIQVLAEEGGPLQPSLFDERDLAEISSPDYPGERLIVCRNPLLAKERAEKREDLLRATEEKLTEIAEACQRKNRPLRGAAKIGERFGRVRNRYKVAKHFRVTITDESFQFERDSESIDREAALDGFYVLRTSVPSDCLEGEQVVSFYKALSKVERAFRSMKTVDIEVRPIFHRREERVRAHVFLCMLAYYVEWHMRGALAPILFDDDDPQAAAQLRTSPVAPARRSPAAEQKARSKRTKDGLPVHSFRTLLKDLATLTLNKVSTVHTPGLEFTTYTEPTAVQKRAFELLSLNHAM